MGEEDSIVMEVEITREGVDIYKTVVGTLSFGTLAVVETFAKKIKDSTKQRVMINENFPGVLKISCDGNSMLIPYYKISYVSTTKYPPKIEEKSA
jgi:hypothetical protein